MKTKITAYDHNGNVLAGFPITCERFGTQTQSPVCYVYKSDITGNDFDMAITAPTIIIEDPIPETTSPETPPPKEQKQEYRITVYANASNLMLDWIATNVICHHHWTAFISNNIQYWISGTVVVTRMGKEGDQH